MITDFDTEYIFISENFGMPSSVSGIRFTGQAAACPGLNDTPGKRCEDQ